ncbi:MAG: RIO1 family regulatory kinase/ATPase [Candidatus Njordarchaeia archaeon]
MSFLEILSAVQKLTPLHFKILYCIEKYMRRFYYVPLQFLSKKLQLKPRKLELILNYLLKMEFVRARKDIYLGYALTYKGLDAIALRSLGIQNQISSIDRKIGVGKESDVWVAYLDDKPRIIKLFRIGRESFKKIRKWRGYLFEGVSVKSWMHISYILAEREFSVLRLLYDCDVRVPEPYTYNRHLLLMNYIEGVELFKARIERPLDVFEAIVREIKKALSCGIIHGDLSEYNIMITPTSDIYIIDWSQYLRKEHNLADSFLRRDINQIMKFFSRKYHISYTDLNDILEKYLSE